MRSRSNITMVKMNAMLRTFACLVTLCLVSSARGQGIEHYNCPPDKPFMCSTYGSCFGYQQYCNIRSNTVDSCFKSNDEDSIRKECTSRQFPIDRACKYACRNRYPDLQPYPEYVELSKVCDHDRQFIGFQAICKGKQTVSCFPENMTSREDKHAFCSSEEGRNLSSQPDSPCRYACEDAFPEFLKKAKTDLENSTTSNIVDHSMTSTTTAKPTTTTTTAKPTTTTTTAKPTTSTTTARPTTTTTTAAVTTTRKTTTSENTKLKADVGHESSPSENLSKDKTAAENPSCSCGKEIALGVAFTAVGFLIFLIIITVYLVKKGKLSFGNANQRKHTNNANSDGTGGTGNQGNNNGNPNGNPDPPIPMARRGQDRQAADPAVVDLTDAEHQRLLNNTGANGGTDGNGENRNDQTEGNE